MSIYEELCAAARARMIRDKKFEVEANIFPERLRRALSNYLEIPERQLELKGRPTGGGEEPPVWDWPELTKLDTNDQDADGFFIFALLIWLDLSQRTESMVVLGAWSFFGPRFKFRPVPDGFDVALLDFRGRDNPHFEIRNDDLKPLLVRLIEDCRQALSFDPFEGASRPRSIGFDTSW